MPNENSIAIKKLSYANIYEYPLIETDISS